MIILEGQQYFTLEEAAAVLQRPKRTIYRWTWEHKIAFNQPYPGARILIPESEIFRLKRIRPAKNM
ncbi:MAG: helix-turn-helix domain-containing protein [Candidatus Cryosericum sp.]